MKKCLVMLLAAALFVVTGCKKDDNNAKKMTFTSDFGGGAKTEISDHSMKWTTGDDIIINGETFACEVKDEGTRAEFTGKVVESPYNAYYPTSIWNEGTLTLPVTQYYDENNLSHVSPMYALSESITLVFHNICALVKLNLKGTGTVKTITASADQSLSGEFTIAGNEADGYYANVPQLRDGAATVTLDCGQGVALDATTPKAFYIALPQGEYTNLKFTVSNGTITKEVTMDENDLTAGTLYEVEKEIEFVATVPVESVSVSPTTLSLVVGATQQLTATVLPENATNKNVTWSSDNTSVATVAADGTVTAVAVGTVNITVTTEDGGKTATCVVTVTAPAPVVPEGALPGKFSVSATKQVYFSKGNLWCDNSTPAAPKWYFENNQYDYHTFGTNANVQGGVASTNVSGDWGLFSWSCYVYDDNETNSFGMLVTKPSYSKNDTFEDWGKNAIENGGKTANQWRTLSSGKDSDVSPSEWQYLLTKRGLDYMWVNAKVHNVSGLIIFPDDFTFPADWEGNQLTNLNSQNAYQVISDANWNRLAAKNCVFLPAAASRNPSNLVNEGKGYYWGSGKITTSANAYALQFLGSTSGFKPGTGSQSEYFGYSVRLVIDVPSTNN